MTINVTQDRIDRGETCNGLDCAVALAIKEDHPEVRLAMVETGFVEIGHGGKMHRVELPVEVSIWISDSDTFEKCNQDGVPLQPIAFDLELPS